MNFITNIKSLELVTASKLAATKTYHKLAKPSERSAGEGGGVIQVQKS